MKKIGFVALSCAALALFALTSGVPAEATTYDFEDLLLGTTYNVGDTFTTNGHLFELDSFQWSSLNWTSSGFAQVDSNGQAGGSGQDLALNNINLDTVFSGPVSFVGLVFGEYGGNLNIEINGDFRNIEQLAAINGLTIGGCAITVTNGFGNDQGTLLAEGSIWQFALGGQELWIDDVSTGDAIPEPAGLGLIGLAMLAMKRRRRP